MNPKEKKEGKKKVERERERREDSREVGRMVEIERRSEGGQWRKRLGGIE